MNFKKMMKRGQEGFTLVELIVVIAILGILGGIAVPAYSGYVEKANYAADEALLAELNTAFAAACAMNGENHTGRNDASATITNKIADVTTHNDKIDGDFDGFYDGGEFKVFTALAYNGQLGQFVEGAAVKFGEHTITISKDLADALKNNNLSDLGAAILLGKVDTVAGIAAGLLDPEHLDNPNSVFEKMIFKNGTADEYLASIATALGISGDEDAQAKFEALAYNADGTPNSSFLANSLVLSAASKTQGMDTSFLGNVGSAKTLRQQLDSTDLATSTDAMAKLALTYGMYTSYINSSYGTGLTDQTDDMLKTGNFSGMTDVLATIENQNFQDYLASDEGKADLDAYLASMQIVNNSASSSPDAALDILGNGFDDPSLEDVLGGLMGSSK